MNPLLPLLFVGVLLVPPASATAAEPAPVCADGQTLSVGVFPRRNPAMTDSMFSPLVELLGRRLGCRVRLKTAADFPRFWAEVEQQAFDLVHYNQYHYVKSAATYAVVAHNEELGSGTVAGAIYVRRDSGITGLADVAGKRVVFGGGADAMMSHIVPRYLLLEAGIAPDSYESIYAPNPPNAVLGVFYGQADAGGAGDVVMRLPVITQRVDASQLAIIASSAPIVHLPWSVKRSLPEKTKQGIRAALLELADDAVGRAALKAAGMSGIAPAVDGDYDACRAIVNKVKAAFPFD